MKIKWKEMIESKANRFAKFNYLQIIRYKLNNKILLSKLDINGKQR